MTILRGYHVYPAPAMYLARGLVKRTLPRGMRSRIKRWGGWGQEAASAMYCRDVWLSHLTRAARAGLESHPTAVAELGPGASLGVGIAALLTGAERYVALDVVREVQTDHNLRLFHELVADFRRSPPEGIPGGWRDSNLDAARLDAIRSRVEAGLDYVVPWDDSSVIDPASIDFLLSHAVMEHVADIDATYRAAFNWLRHGAWMSHQIDFDSHNTAPVWNGHWGYSTRYWNLVGGGLINRWPLSRHLAAIDQAGFSIRVTDVQVRNDGLDATSIHRELRPEIATTDLLHVGALVQAVRPMV